MQTHPLQQARETNVWYPFDGLGEWLLAKFLVENLSQMQINKFLKLDWTREQPQFKSKDELFFYMQQLPGRRPKWQCMKLKLKGYESEQPIHLIWRDGLEVTKQLFTNPVYTNHMCYDPHYIYQGQEHQFREFWTSDDAWEIQVRVTIIPIITASDKTPVTKHMGGLEMHPLFLTIRNIQGNIHMKAMLHAWQCTAFMLIPTFIMNSNFQTLLWLHLWHKCMDLVCSNLKVTAHVARLHITDLPEQLMTACITKNSSPVTTVTQKEFGDETLHPPWNGINTYTLIQQLCTHVDPWDLVVFLREAKKLCLSRVHLPYWRNWRRSNPARFLTPEILHALHKFFFNHFKSHHKHTGVCHFSGGVSHVNQMTGQEHWDIQCTIVLMLWGMASPGFTHAGKSSAKDDFFIPKLELMQSFAHAISHVGLLMQWMADMSECLLITHCKHPFECTSCQRDFILQIAHILNREETIRLFDLYTLLSSSLSMPGQDPLINAIIMEDEEVASTETDPAFAWVSNANQATQLCLQVLHPIHNHFLKGILSDNTQIAFNVTSLYNISDFYHALHLYVTCNGCILPGQLSSNTWMKFHIQLHSTFHACRIMPSQQIHAEPPSSNFPWGNCDVVLFNQQVDGGNNDASGPTLPKGSRVQVTECLSQPLVYIQLFDFVVPGSKPSTGMWMVRRSYTQHPSQLEDIMHTVEIIPVYQGPLGKDVNSGNSLEVFNEYFLNNFTDKELYHSLSVISDN
ncbi:uncharacterized protein BJ212DRAFT_1446220 [Suillus subaureus]|uniref:DUF6830 domain-containing protein n=1 Tax=Suillus subaureus TaxID=48587 RepID=A0A9P7EF55_9AGAM|nr:uncharacterized protein BJ212DRAFT_1446220 [Suillus subaureus]KAG1819088.1 hypothetical protein BJ212DRAFT_1446220 [Suillus subaureus]